MRCRRFTGLLALAILAAGAAPAAADDLAAQCSDAGASTYVQDVMNASSPGDVITLAEGSVCNPADDELSEFRLPPHQITLQGNGTGEPEIFDGGNENRTLRGSNVGATVIRNLTFRDGDYSGSGAAIKIQGESTPTISNIVVIDTESDERAPVTIEATGGGGTVRVENSFFGSSEDDDGNGNEGQSGGALHIDTAHAIVVAGNTFSGNHAQFEGGGVLLKLDNSAPGVPVTVTGNTFSGNEVIRSGDRFFNEAVGGGLAIRTPNPTERPVTQSGNRFIGNNVIAGNGNTGPELGRGSSGVDFIAAGGGEYTEAVVTSTNDRYVGNSAFFVPIGPKKGATRGGDGGVFVAGGGLAVASPDLDFTGRNLVAAGNGAFGFGGGISVVDRPPLRGDNLSAAPRGDSGGVLRLLDSTVVSNGAFAGSAIAGDSDDDLVAHNDIVYGNAGAEGSDEVNGFDDGGTRDVRFTDLCEQGASTPVAGEGNLCVNPDLVDPANGDVHQKAASPTRDQGSDALVPPDLTGDWEGDARISDSGTDGVRVDMGADELGVPGPPAPPQVQPQAQPPAGAVAGAQQRSCKSKREFRIRIRVPKGKKALSAVVRVNGKKVKVVRGKRLRAPVRLRGLPRGTFRVRITIRLKNGKRISGTRTYHTCIPKLPGDGPPPV